MPSMVRSMVGWVEVGVLLAIPGVARADDWHGHGLSIAAVSNPHPDLVSGGDVLLRVSAPAGIPLNSTDVTRAFARQPDGTLLGLVTGLRDGPNLVTAQRGRAAARLVVVNHSI